MSSMIDVICDLMYDTILALYVCEWCYVACEFDLVSVETPHPIPTSLFHLPSNTFCCACEGITTCE